MQKATVTGNDNLPQNSQGPAIEVWLFSLARYQVLWQHRAAMNHRTKKRNRARVTDKSRAGDTLEVAEVVREVGGSRC